MKTDKLSEAIGLLDDELIDSARKARKKKKRRNRILKGVVAAVLAVCLITAGVLNSSELPEEEYIESNIPGVVYAIAEAEYPEAEMFPDVAKYTDELTGELDDKSWEKQDEAWQKEHDGNLKQLGNKADGLYPFFSESSAEFFSDTDGENLVYSPLNTYFALCMLAEVTEGDSRAQILELLGQEDIEALRKQSSAVWKANYNNDGATTSIFANSMWLNESLSYNQDVLDLLAEQYYASSYRGTMGSKDMNEKLQEWLNKQTGGMLEEYVQGLYLRPDTIMALASTIWYQAKWDNEFEESDTTEGVFHSTRGDVTCEFMNQTEAKKYYWGEDFSATTKKIKNGGDMWLFLPEEDVDAEELLADEEVWEILEDSGSWNDCGYYDVQLSMPKFDVSSEMDLLDGLEELGITDIFDGGESDFSPLLENSDGVAINEVKHAGRVTVDEEGCKAAAYTVMTMWGCGDVRDYEDIEFVLDRPFVFVITSEAGQPLFVGVVNQPN